jgi:hypothetical protein
LALTSPTSGGRSVGIVQSRTQVTEFVYFIFGFVLTKTEKQQIIIHSISKFMNVLQNPISNPQFGRKHIHITAITVSFSIKTVLLQSTAEG